MSNENLLSCPFCGGEATLLQGQSKDWLVYCADVYKCGTEGWWEDTQEEAITAWNRRAEDADRARLEARVAELEAECVRLTDKASTTWECAEIISAQLAEARQRLFDAGIFEDEEDADHE